MNAAFAPHWQPAGGNDLAGAQTTVTPPDPTRSRWFIDDVPEFVRIDHPRRKVFRATGGTSAAAAQRARARAEREAAGTGHQPRPVFVWSKDDGLAREYVSLAGAEAELGTSMSKRSRTVLQMKGWVNLLGSYGVAIWFHGEPVPECVGTFAFAKDGNLK